MMKNIENREPLLWIGLLCLISLWAIEICAQGKSASATANVTVTIVSPIGIEKKSDLRFGDIVGGKGGGAVSVEAENSILLRGAVSLGPSNGKSVSTARFLVTGSPHATYTIVLPPSLTLTRQGGSEVLIMDEIQSKPSETGRLSNKGEQTVTVGGTIHIEENQPIGIYESLEGLSVTVSYQ
jgi:hypothetical protein